MKGYIFDTNIWSHWFEGKDFVADKIQHLDPQSPIYLSVIVWGEVIFGAKANPKFSIDKYTAFIQSQKPIIIPVNETVSEEFGGLKARLFEKKSPKELRTTTCRADMLRNPLPTKYMGVHENDLWIASQAIAYNLVLVTHEKMGNILEIASDVLAYEIWK
jgi:predicted nucleic acid-binding protein